MKLLILRLTVTSWDMICLSNAFLIPLPKGDAFSRGGGRNANTLGLRSFDAPLKRYGLGKIPHRPQNPRGREGGGEGGKIV